MTEKLTKQQIDALRSDGWRTYNSESTSYDYLIVRELDGKTVTRRIKIKGQR